MLHSLRRNTYLQNGTYGPHKKPSNRLLYIDKLSNHAPNVKKQISNSIQDRLSKNMSNEEIFNTASCEQNDALKKSEFKVDFKYNKNQRQKPKYRTRNIIWFNSPFNTAVSTNVAKNFSSIDQQTFSKVSQTTYQQKESEGQLQLYAKCA